MKYLLLILLFITSGDAYAQLTGELGILDLTANSGINPETGSAWLLGDNYRLVFVSTTSRNASSTSISDYNTHVQTAANAAGLGSVNWYAIGSTSTVDARDNTYTTSSDTDGSIFLMDGSQVAANNIADLWDGAVDTRIDIDENGGPNGVTTPIWATWTAVWTGTASNGIADASKYLGAEIITMGLSEAELNFWTRRSSYNDKTVSLPLYGISEVLTIQAALPIELLNFGASLIDINMARLDWQTTSETNNDYFTIERSVDGIQWSELTRVNGAGNSSSLLSYSAFDYDPNSGISYYRLKQTDFDGQFTYSQIVIVKIDQLINSQLEIYPNPTSDLVTILGNAFELEQVKIYDVLGQDLTIYVKQISNSGSQLVIDLSSLNEGIYYIKTKTNISRVHKQ